MKTKLLKKFRKRFDVIPFGEKSFALLDHKEQKMIYKVPFTSVPLTTRSMAVTLGISMLLGLYELMGYLKTRNKRIYKSHLRRS